MRDSPQQDDGPTNMELRDVKSMQIPAAPGAPSFADEFPEAQRRYGLRQPTKQPYLIAAIVSAFWFGAAIAFVAGYLGFDGLVALDWPWLAGLVFAVAFPIALVWFAAHLSRRSLGLQLASEDLLQIAARLIEPDAAAGREITRLGRAVRREIDALNAGLDTAFSRVRTLESSVAERLQSVEDAARGVEERGEAIRAALRAERDDLAALTHTLGGDAERMGEAIRQRAAAMRQMVKEANDDVLASYDAMDQRTNALRAALEGASALAHGNAQTADRGAATLIAAAESLDSRLESFLQRGERQRSALGEAVTAMKAEIQALESSMGRNLDALGGMGQALAEQTRRAETVAAEIARRGEAATGGLSARAEAIAAAFTGHVERLDSSAAAAEEHLRTVSAVAAEAAERVRTTFELAAHDAAAASQKSGAATAASMEEVSAALEALNAKAEQARQNAAQAIADLRAEADALPSHITERIKEMRAAEMAALLPPPEPEPAKIAPPPEAEAPTETAGGKPEWFGFARRLAGKIRRENDPQAQGDWRLSTALANAEQTAPPLKPTPKASVDLHAEALHVVEKLQALAIDLDRALGDDPAPDLWRRYVNGERGVFTRRLVASIGREGADRIAQRYAADADFRLHADRYMTEFEGLLDDASARDRDQILVETFLTSQTGRLYLLVAAATGRL